jgi:putative ABC transport system substrate-binding protein
VIVTAGEEPTRALKNVTTTVPVVMVATGDPVGAKFVASLAHPGGNITGLSTVSLELATKRLALLKEAFPRVSRVAVIWNVTDPVKRLDMLQTEVAAKTLGLTLLSVGVRGPDEFENTFADIRKERADVIVTLADELTVSRRDEIIQLAAPTRLPTVYEQRDFVDAGGLLSYGPSLSDLFRRAATYVDKILKGARPGDLPVGQPAKFELVVNASTARAIGMAIPRAVLQRADQVLP